MNEPQTFRKKPVEIQAMQWTGDNAAAMHKWMPQDFNEGGSLGPLTANEYTASIWVEANSGWLRIVTGEWVIKDSKGFYPCKADVFEQTYERVGGA